MKFKCKITSLLLWEGKLVAGYNKILHNFCTVSTALVDLRNLSIQNRSRYIVPNSTIWREKLICKFVCSSLNQSFTHSVTELSLWNAKFVYQEYRFAQKTFYSICNSGLCQICRLRKLRLSFFLLFVHISECKFLRLFISSLFGNCLDPYGQLVLVTLERAYVG